MNDIEIVKINLKEPWCHKSLDFHYYTEDTLSDINYFTDGSKLLEHVGGAFVSFTFGIEYNHLLFILDDHCTVFQAELYAIYLAVKDGKEKFAGKNFNIYSDSMSSLQALSHFCDPNGLALMIQDEINYDSKIKLFWVKAHAGTYQNELADYYAKEATKLTDVDVHLPWSRGRIKKSLLKESIGLWQRAYLDSDHASQVKLFFKKVNLNRLSGDFYLNQIITSPGCFPVHQQRLFGAENDCICGNDIGSVNHIIYDCTLFSDLRTKFFPRNYLSCSLPNLLSSERSKCGLSSIVYSYMKIVFESNYL